MQQHTDIHILHIQQYYRMYAVGRRAAAARSPPASTHSVVMYKLPTRALFMQQLVAAGSTVPLQPCATATDLPAEPG